MPRPGSPGYRRRSAGKKGEFTDNRIAWANTAAGQMVLMKYEEKEDDKESGPTVKVLLPRPGTRTTVWDFTHLTSEELQIVREFFNLAFAEAEPVVAQRDRVAADAFAAGDDSYSRSYRQVPQFIVRQGQDGKHRQGVHDGPASIPDAGVSGDVGEPGGVRGAGGDVAHDESPEGERQDDGA